MRIAVRCDALTRLGVGHLVRQLALAEELGRRGHQVVFHGRTDLAWAREQLAIRGLELRPIAEPADAAAAELVASGADLVLMDGYAFDPDLGAAVRGAGLPVAMVVDGPFGTEQAADLYLDQNLGAEPPVTLGNPSGRWHGGIEYALLRDLVVQRRLHLGERAQQSTTSPRVLVVFGGTDPFGGAPVAAELVLATGRPVQVIAIASDATNAEQLAALPRAEGQSLEVLARTDDLPALAVDCDVVVSASGSTVWELACLGVATGLVCVVDNQQVGYRIATGMDEHGSAEDEAAAGREQLCVPVGILEQLRVDPSAREQAVEQLGRLLDDSAWRHRLAVRGQQLVDGRGRERVADLLEGLPGRPQVSRATG